MTDQVLTIILKGENGQLTGTLNASAADTQKLGAAFDALGVKMKRSSDQAKETGKDLEDAGKTGAEIGKRIGEGVGIAAIAFGTLVAHSVELADKTYLASQRIGVTVEALSSLGATARRNGGDLDAVIGGLDSLNESAVRAASGVGQTAKQYSSAFAALGISVKDTSGAIKPTLSLLQEVAVALDKLPDGALKSRLSQQLLGSSSKELTGTLHELAQSGLAGVEAAAAATGEQLSGKTAAAAHELADRIDDLRGRISGFATSVASATVPTLLALADTLTDTGEGANKVGSESTLLRGFMEGLGRAVIIVTGGFKVLFTVLYSGLDILGSIKDLAGATVNSLGLSAKALGQLASGDFKAATATMKQSQDDVAKGWTGIKTAAAGAYAGITGATADVSAALEKYDKSLADSNKTTAESNSVSNDAKNKADAQAAALKRLQDALANTARQHRAEQAALVAYSNDLQKLTDLENQWSSGLAGPYLQNLKQYQQQVDFITKTWIDASVAGKANDELLQRLGYDLEQARDSYERTNQQIREQHDLMTQSNNDLRNQIALWDVLPSQQAAVTAGLQKYDDLMKSHYDFFGNYIKDEKELQQALDDQLPSYISTRQAIEDVAAAQKAAEGAVNDYVNVYVTAGQSIAQETGKLFTGQVKSWKQFSSDVLGIVKQMVASIIAQIFTLSVVNPFLNQMFGGILNLATSGSVAGSAGGQASGLSGLLNLFGGGSGGGSSILGSIGNLFGGGAGSAAAAGGTLGDFTGPGTQFLNYGGEYNVTGAATQGIDQGFNATANYGTNPAGPSALGTGLSIAGGVYAGYNEYNAAGGGLGGIAGAAAYGYGTYALGTAASTAFAGGITAGLGAIPVFGWIAIAAMLVDKFSGGKLFGTSYQTIGATSALNIGPDGSSADVQLQQSKQSALFGGKKYRDKTTAASPEMVDAASQLQDSYTQLIKGVADSIGIETPNLIAESLKTIQKFDKKGNVTSTEYQVDVNGKTYTEATAELQQTRAAAEQIIATISHSDIGKDAETIAEQWRKSATALMDGAQLLGLATADIVHGQSLLGDDTSLQAVVDITQKLQGSNETLAQTYVRLQTETQTVTATLTTLGLTTSKAGAEFVQFSDDMATAAGGVQNLSSLWNAYYNAYFTDSERAANKLKADQLAASKLGADIGQDPTQSMAQFRETFTSVFDSLSAEDVVKWLQFGNAIAIVNADLGTTADVLGQAQQKYDAYIQSFRDAINPLTEFQTSMKALGGTLADNIAQANDLAKAAGMSGASIDDLTTIIQANVIQGAAAFAKLEADTQQRVDKLFGSSIDRLQEKLNTVAAGGAQNVQQVVALQAQIDAAKQQQDAASKLADATALIQNLGQIGAVSGESLDDLAKRYGFSSDQLAQYLGTDAAGLQKQFDVIEQQTLAAISTSNNTKYTNELLADILAQYRGEPLPYSIGDLQSAQTGTSQAVVDDGGKPGGRTARAPLIAAPQPATSTPLPTAPPASGGTGAGDTDPGKQIGRVADAVDGNGKAVSASIDDVADVLVGLKATIQALSDRIDRQRLARVS